MSPIRPLRREPWLVALASVIMAVPMSVLLAGVPAQAAPAADEPSLSVSGVRATPGQLRLTLTAGNLPPGTTLSEPDVRVEADGVRLGVTVGRVDSTPGKAATRAVVLVLDASASMAGAPLLAARAAAIEYARRMPADVALGVVSFADRPVTRLAPTTDRSRVEAALLSITAAGKTTMFDGVQQAKGLLAGADVARIVVLTDGADIGSTVNSQALARDLANAHVTLDAVAFASNAGGDDVRALARATGGTVVTATDAASLNAVFQELASALAATMTVTATVPSELAGRSVTVRTTLTLPGLPPATASARVTFGPNPAEAATLTTVAVPRPPAWLLAVAVASVSLGLLVLCLGLVYGLDGRSRHRQRMRQVERSVSPAAASGPSIREGSPVVRAMLSVSEQAIHRQGSQTRLEEQLDQAGMDLRPAEWILIRAGVAAGAGVLLALALPWWLGLPVGVLGGWIGTALYRRMRTVRRAQRFADMLPESLQLVVSALRSGFSFPQAIDAVIREGDEPVATEFGRAAAETRLGADLADALVRTSVRNRNTDLAWLVMAIRVQREVGGNLSEVVETAVETMRERGRLHRFVRGLSAEGRLSAIVLTGIPIVLAGFMFMFRREYLRPLYTTGLGVMMLAGCVVLMGLGMFWMSRLIKVEV